MENKLLILQKFFYQGRLANMCLQLASGLGIAKKCGRELAVPIWPYEEFFEGYIKVVERNIKENEIRELGFAYCGDYLQLKLNNNIPSIDLSGYFQSERYFEHCIQDVKAFFMWKEEKFRHIREKYENLLGYNTVAIHVRRGDYVGHEGYIQLPMSYYISSLRMIEGKYKVAIFSDDIEWCKRNFSLVNRDITYIEGNRNIDDLYLMSKMTNCIIANSTFSWWGAWLGEGRGKIIHPGALFKGSMKDYDIKDFFPKRWIKNDIWKD